ncbi:carbohydrate ABC transporter permease [Flaviflexus salsibiostraticola]|uniref:Carbohydrate ABC transporter permease n=1 Tax=Flaviflexus salsibiostraticola TaxID=1282737 RepID=A0A3Q8WTZ4_9ACTO|nr:carbohydrate ABC transporter permease [Flaviflexus salsibiostraticola]AZN30205.1 carbohydrate ABC transporter permease [Flaviflexus salsibiostraticola]
MTTSDVEREIADRSEQGETQRKVKPKGSGRSMMAGERKKTVGGRIVALFNNSLVNAILVIVALMWLVPTIGLFFSSLRSSQANATSGWWTVFFKSHELTIDNYRSLLGNDTMVQSLVNTIIIVVPTTLAVVAIGAMAGYALAWIDFPGRDWVLIGVVALMAVPLQVAFIPLARLFGSIGIFGTYAAVILFHIAFGLPFAVFLLRNYFTNISEEMLEAARIDGASEMRIFLQVALPLAMPAIASLAIFQFLWSWNDMLVALIFAGPGSQPITVAIQSQLRQFSSNIDILSAGAFVSMVVPLLVYFAFQRYFVSAIMAGTTK